jgi:threonine dehydrogenase-like Zn-dependent dehydrogenase
MRALTVTPLKTGSLAVEDVPDPQAGPGELLVDGLAVGVCGTDHEIADGDYGWAPPGRDRLIIGHESLGRVRTAPHGSDFAPGDLVVGVVRRPDPRPCGACAHGQFDMCRNGEYTERGIKQRDGYASEQWTVEQDYAVKLDARLEPVGMLMEPTTVVAKAWDEVYDVGHRSWFEPRTALVTGAGPIGLLAALLGVQRGLDVHVLDVVSSGPKPDLVRALGATYHADPADQVASKVAPDVVIEATGVGSVIFGCVAGMRAYGILCLTGVSPIGRKIDVDAGALNREIVLDNNVIIGSVNANLHHYAMAAQALAKADVGWLSRLLSRRVPLAKFADAFARHDDDVKVVLDLAAS